MREARHEDRGGARERRFCVYEEAPGFRPGPRAEVGVMDDRRARRVDSNAP